MILGLALAYARLAWAGAVFYLIHHSVWSKSQSVFFVGGIAGPYYRLTELLGCDGWAVWSCPPPPPPFFAGDSIWLISRRWSLAEYTATLGILGQIRCLVPKASLDAGVWISRLLCDCLSGIFTLLSMSKIWNESFLKAHPAGPSCLEPRECPDGAPGSPFGVLALIYCAPLVWRADPVHWSMQMQQFSANLD